jgi:hypothetical protein
MSQDIVDRSGPHLRLVHQRFRKPSVASIPAVYHIALCEVRAPGLVLMDYRYVRPDSLPATDGSRASRLFNKLGIEEDYTDLGALTDQHDPRFAQLLDGRG